MSVSWLRSRHIRQLPRHGWPNKGAATVVKQHEDRQHSLCQFTSSQFIASDMLLLTGLAHMTSEAPKNPQSTNKVSLHAPRFSFIKPSGTHENRKSGAKLITYVQGPCCQLCNEVWVKETLSKKPAFRYSVLCSCAFLVDKARSRQGGKDAGSRVST